MVSAKKNNSDKKTTETKASAHYDLIVNIRQLKEDLAREKALIDASRHAHDLALRTKPAHFSDSRWESYQINLANLSEHALASAKKTKEIGEKLEYDEHALHEEIYGSTSNADQASSNAEKEASDEEWTQD